MLRFINANDVSGFNQVRLGCVDGETQNLIDECFGRAADDEVRDIDIFAEFRWSAGDALSDDAGSFGILSRICAADGVSIEIEAWDFRMDFEEKLICDATDVKYYRYQANVAICTKCNTIQHLPHNADIESTPCCECRKLGMIDYHVYEESFDNFDDEDVAATSSFTAAQSILDNDPDGELPF